MIPTTTVIEYGSHQATVHHASVGRAPSVLVTFERPPKGDTLVHVHTIDGDVYPGEIALTFREAHALLRHEAPGALLSMAAAVLALRACEGIIDPDAEAMVAAFLG